MSICGPCSDGFLHRSTLCLTHLAPGIARADTIYKLQPVARLGEMAGDTLLGVGVSR